MSARPNLVGRRYGSIVVEAMVLPNDGETRWHCRCDCGGTRIVSTNHLTQSKHSKTFGCTACKARRVGRSGTRHGGCSGGVSRLWMVWYSMRQRCANPNVPTYHYYGGKGVRVCAEWEDFGVFQAWALANGYAQGMTIDRIDSNGPYAPSNCQWIARADNIRRAHLGRPKRKTRAHGPAIEA